MTSRVTLSRALCCTARWRTLPSPQIHQRLYLWYLREVSKSTRVTVTAQTGDGRVTVTSETANPVSRFLPTLSLGGEFTRAATRKRRTGQRGANVSDREVFSLCDIIGEKKKYEVSCWQSENRRDSVNASIAGGSPQPNKLAQRLLTCIAGSGRTP